MNKLNIKEKKIQLNAAIREDNLKLAIETSRDMGLSMTYICKAANVNVGNLCSFINGKLPYFNDKHKQRVYKIMGDLLLNEI